MSKLRKGELLSFGFFRVAFAIIIILTFLTNLNRAVPSWPIFPMRAIALIPNVHAFTAKGLVSGTRVVVRPSEKKAHVLGLGSRLGSFFYRRLWAITTGAPDWASPSRAHRLFDFFYCQGRFGFSVDEITIELKEAGEFRPSFKHVCQH